MSRARVALLAALAAALPWRPARAWEAATTHAGLAEQAATGSLLHRRLRTQLGLTNGLFDELTMPPADAPSLFAALRLLNPTHGYVPDGRGRQSALGWLVAGAVIADSPVAQAVNHFYDPIGKRGLSDHSLARSGLVPRLRLRVRAALVREGIPTRGLPAPEWVVAPGNPLNLDAFLGQYEKAIAARTPGERSRHLAAALIAAGALVHVLQDMASPSHVRDDLAAHLQPIGDDPTDIASRFERIAALAFGRLGVPGPQRKVTRARLRDFFTADDGLGLADLTARRFFSAVTLPGTITVAPKARASVVLRAVASHLARPAPAPGRIDLRAAAGDGGRLTDELGVCLAGYRLVDEQLVWSIPDPCAVEQLGALLPEASAYGAGLIDWLFRGALALEAGEGGLVVRVAETDLGPGALTLLWEDGRGVRAAVQNATRVEGGAVGAQLATLGTVPAGARALIGLYRGVDGAGQPVVATGRIALAAPAPAPAPAPTTHAVVK